MLSSTLNVRKRRTIGHGKLILASGRYRSRFSNRLKALTQTPSPEYILQLLWPR